MKLPDQIIIESKDAQKLKQDHKNIVSSALDSFTKVLGALAAAPIPSYILTWFFIDSLEKFSYADWKKANSLVVKNSLGEYVSFPTPDRYPFVDFETAANLKTTITAFFAASAATGILNTGAVAGIISSVVK